MNQKPKYIIVAGVNGAGKSTLYQTMPELFQDTLRINADEILRQQGGDWRKNSDNFGAMHVVLKTMKNALEEKISFHQETTLAGVGHQKRIENAKEQGFEVTLLYVGLESYELAINRVKQRVKKGGHGIPDEVIKKRYTQSLKHLTRLAPICDNVAIYDNTSNFIPIYERQGRRIVLNDSALISWIPKLTCYDRERK